MLERLWDIKVPEKHKKIIKPEDCSLIQKSNNLIVNPENMIVTPCVVAESSDQEFVGNIPVRQNIEVLGPDEPKQLKLGWFIFEDIGDGFYNGKRKYNVCG